MSKNQIKSNRDFIVQHFSEDELHQFMDCGKSIPSNFQLSGKSKTLFGIMKRFPIGYRVDYTALVERKWKKWVANDPMFKDNDVLSATDIKKTIKGYYLAVAKGELTFKDGSKRMLRFVMSKDRKLTLEVVPFVEVFSISEPAKKDEKEKNENPVITKLENLEKNATSEAEAEILRNAIAELKKLHGSKAVKVA